MDGDFNPPGFLTEDEFDEGDLDDFANFSRNNRAMIRSNKINSNIGMNRMPPELIITPAKVSLILFFFNKQIFNFILKKLKTVNQNR